MTQNNDHLTRRDFLTGTAAVLAATAIAPSWSAAQPAASLGEWLDDDNGLPAYHYTGPLRFTGSPVRDGEPMLPDDPYFLTGNYRLTLFTHASGLYQILTGERAWGRMNQGDAPFSGGNDASITLNGNTQQLIGLDAPAAAAAGKHFGVGFARYRYQPQPALEITRTLSVAPSTTLRNGASAFLMQVRLRNTGTQPLQLTYKESVRAHYQQLFATWDESQREVTFAPQPVQHPAANIISAGFTAKGRRRLTFAPPGQMTRFEQSPPTLFVAALGNSAKTIEDNGSIGIEAALTLAPGKEHTLSFVTGYTREATPEAIHRLTAQLTPADDSKQLGSAFAEFWKKQVPAFSSEQDKTLRREMRWNAAALEAMATWREYYDETVIPQGTMYDYIWGNMASSRDLAQQALPFCHTNPAIARSTLRFIMKRMLPDGLIQLNDMGFGWEPSGAQQTSDQQLYFFLLLNEYLRATKDTSIFTEQIGYYPLENSGHDTGLAHVRQAFLFLRDRVGTGPHGIIRRWNSDWNDMFGWWPSTIPYNTEFELSESHMNSAMAIVILGDLAAHLNEADELTAAIREYRDEVHQAWNRDLGTRAFPRRAYIDYKSVVGENNMWLEPQGYTLLIPEFPVENKRRLYTELQRRLLTNEAIGARQVEAPSANSATPPGSRENGGFWYALNGPLILGVATFDQEAANNLLRKMTFTNYAQHYPGYWTGRWSASDSLDSSLLKTSGLSTAIPWCAHAHAWPLYCYLRLREDKTA